MTDWPWNEPWEFDGWFETEQNQRLFGQMRHTPEDGPTFHFVGDPASPAQSMIEPAPMQRIRGQTVAGQPITVFDFVPTRWTTHGPARLGTLDGFANTIANDEVVVPFDELTASDFSVGLDHLVDFLRGGTMDAALLMPPRQEPSPDCLVDYRIDDHASLRLYLGSRKSMSRGREESTVTAHATVTCAEPLTTRVLDHEYLTPLQQLVTFSTRRRTSVSAWTLDSASHTRMPLRILQRPWPRTDVRSTRDVHALALNLATVPDAASVIESWFRLRRSVGAVWPLFFANIGAPDGLLEDRFLSLLAFSEGYHRALHDKKPLSDEQDQAARQAVAEALKGDRAARRVFKAAIAHANSQTQRERLAHLLGRATDILGTDWPIERDEWLAKLIHTRNWMIHWGARGRHTVEDSGELIHLIDQLEFVIYANLLTDLGLDADSVRTQLGSAWRVAGLP